MLARELHQRQGQGRSDLTDELLRRTTTLLQHKLGKTVGNHLVFLVKLLDRLVESDRICHTRQHQQRVTLDEPHTVQEGALRGGERQLERDAHEAHEKRGGIVLVLGHGLQYARQLSRVSHETLSLVHELLEERPRHLGSQLRYLTRCFVITLEQGAHLKLLIILAEHRLCKSERELSLLAAALIVHHQDSSNQAGPVKAELVLDHVEDVFGGKAANNR